MVLVEAGGIRLWVHAALRDLTSELVTRTAMFYLLKPATCASYSFRPNRATDYPPAMPDEEIPRRLLALNLERAAAQSV